MIENNLLHEHSLFLRGCFRVQINLFNYLWNLKTLILEANIKEDQQISAIWEPQNVCLLERRKKGAELWDLVSIYRDQKTLKNRHGWLGCEFGCILLRKDRKDALYRHPKGVRPKPKRRKFGLLKCRSALQKCWMVLLDAKHTFVFVCVLDSPSMVFWSDPCT